MSTQLNLCAAYPAAHSLYRVVELNPDAAVAGKQISEQQLVETRPVAQLGNYLEAARIARHHCLTSGRQCLVVDLNDGRYIALRVHPSEYCATAAA